MSVSDTNLFNFNLVNNVYIDVVDKDMNRVKKHIEIHNKATRKMVTGLLRFLSGHFNGTYTNDVTLYDSAKDYIPCYIGFGYGGTTINNIPLDQGGQQEIDDTAQASAGVKIPKLNSDWTTEVDYASTKMVLEIPNKRSRIRKASDTFTQGQPNVGDMDGIFFYCEASPDYLNQINEDKAIFITELGLFADSDSSKEDLLAYIKLGNYEETVETETETKTNVLYIRPVDTVIIRWVITIAAVGSDSRLNVNTKDEYGQETIENTLVAPEIKPMDINVID